MDRPVLARHAARELLLAGDYPSAPLHASRRRLLEALYANPMCGGPARETTLRVLEELRSRFESVATEARRAIGVAENPLEVVHLRLGAIHARRALENAAQLSAGGMPSSGTAETDIDDIARGRLRALRCGLETALVGGRATEPEPASLPQLLRSLDRIDRLLGPPPPERGRLDRVREESAGRARAASARLSGRITLGPDDGGLELAPLIGSKAANLGEIGGVLGRGIIPPWFAVTDHAFRRALAAPIARTPSDGGGYPPSAPTLDRAIEAVLRRSDLDTSRKALAIRRLWCAVHLPSAVADALAEAYRDLSAGGPGNAPAGGGPGDAFVAVRSSAAEEDAEESAWAGQFDTFLFVRGVESLLAHLKLAWAGLWSERAIEHRRLFAPPDARPSGGGVIVQRMVDSRVSGVVHTACAATGQVREMAVNVGFGLGEGIVSGTVEVDQIFVSKEGDLRSGPLRFRYRVGDKRERIVFDAATGEGTRRTETLYHQRLRPALSYAELRELVQAAARLEAAYAEPLDIEFAYEDLALRILQARPVPRFHAALRETVSRHPIEPARALPGRNPR
jgi:pyruvate,water dikinase